MGSIDNCLLIIDRVLFGSSDDRSRTKPELKKMDGEPHPLNTCAQLTILKKTGLNPRLDIIYQHLCFYAILHAINLMSTFFSKFKKRFVPRFRDKLL